MAEETDQKALQAVPAIGAGGSSLDGGKSSGCASESVLSGMGRAVAVDCPSCLNGCGGVRSDCPMREGGPAVRPAVGRPSKFTEDVADAILDMIMLGKSMREICDRADMPHRTTVLRWLTSNEEFASRCARAREIQADAMDDMILDAANACDGENYQATRVKISAYQWRAAKLLPKRYGDKITQEHTGPGGGPVVTSTIVTDDPAEAARAYQRIISGEGE